MPSSSNSFACVQQPAHRDDQYDYDHDDYDDCDDVDDDDFTCDGLQAAKRIPDQNLLMISSTCR